MPHWSAEQPAPLGGAGYAVSLIAGKGTTVAMAGAVVLADALADRPGAINEALAAYEAKLRPWVEAAQRMARRNVHLFAHANRFQLLVREVVLRLAVRPSLAPLVKACAEPGGRAAVKANGPRDLRCRPTWARATALPL